MTTLESLEQEVEKIKLRNKKVEAEKAWETSLVRKLVISVLTYLVISTFFIISHFERPFTSAIVPTVGFLLANLSIPFFKEIYIKHLYKK